MTASALQSAIELAPGSSISVIIPVKNLPDLIVRAITRALHQSYRVFEVIFVDDGSTDYTLSTVKGMQKDNDRIHLLRYGASIGVNVARDAGLRESVGELVAFLDSGDMWAMEKIAMQIDTLAAILEPVAILFQYVPSSVSHLLPVSNRLEFSTKYREEVSRRPDRQASFCRRKPKLQTQWRSQ